MAPKTRRRNRKPASEEAHAARREQWFEMRRQQEHARLTSAATSSAADLTIAIIGSDQARKEHEQATGRTLEVEKHDNYEPADIQVVANTLMLHRQNIKDAEDYFRNGIVAPP